ncbi:unnamed protein product [Rotaria magnacalcarata]|uniref:Uncharacterized protein n=2 Tax=Rotaria magnacalcarata TaxID=392030 RepID=A0A816XWZ0_9BILA|nr:unnamed protein product [Rotaria magnacalcarata]CAF1673944.1 unnamed protein product [Rotaria magnacalcarata]CAF2153198.1 unnamed protein product [Rotaria magnacalcarata]
MNFYHLTSKTHRPQTKSSNFNEDAHCDNEVNLILEKNNTQHLVEQSLFKEQQQQPQQRSIVVNQTDQYYFVPIRELNTTMALSSNNNNTNIIDGSSILLPDLNNPSTQSLFDYSSSTPTMNPIDLPTVNKSNNNFNLSDADLAALFVSTLVSTTSSTTATLDNENELSTNNNNALDDVFLQQVNELVCSSQQKSMGPPPGFENFLFDNSLPSETSRTLSSISNAAIQSQVSSSDTINFSQLLPSAIVDSQQQQPIGGNVHSSSSHSSFQSDEQSIFFPMSNHHYSSTSSSQIFSTNTPSSINTTTTNSANSIAKPYTPNSLSLKTKNFSSIDTSNLKSPISNKINDSDTITRHDDTTPNHIFASPNSFFSNGQKDFASTKLATAKSSSNNRQSSSSASSSTSSSIDEALIQLSQQQKQQSNVQTTNKLFYDDSLSIFNYSSPQSTAAAPPTPTITAPATSHIAKQQRAVNDNINFLASMASTATSESTWQQAKLHSNTKSKQKMQSTILEQQPSLLPQSPSRNSTTNMHDLMENLNELCYRGFDELNALIQEQRWVENYLNVNSPSPASPLVNINGTNCCSARILVVPEYFIFKCKKIEISASDIYELLSVGRPELRLRDLMFVFKPWKDSIVNAEVVHQEEEAKLRLSTERPHSFYMNETVLQAVFDRVCYAVRQLSIMTQQVRAAFQYATLNVFQISSRQQQQQQAQPSTNTSLSSNIIAFAQLQAMQQQKSSSVHRAGGSLRTTP